MLDYCIRNTVLKRNESIRGRICARDEIIAYCVEFPNLDSDSIL